MDTARCIRAVLPPDTLVTSLDAFHHIPIRQAIQKYLGDKRFCYLVLPLGIKMAQWAFTKVARQVRNGLCLKTCAYTST